MNEITRTGWDVLDEARAMLRAAVAGVPAAGWQRPTPCTDWPVTQVIALFAEVAYAVLFLVALRQKRSAAGSSDPSGHSAYGGYDRTGTERAAVHRRP